MLQNVLAAVIGLAVAVLTVMLFDWLSHSIYPPQPDLELSDSAAMRAYVASMPMGALLLVLAGSILAAFDGTLVACLIGRTKPAIYALVIGGLMLVATISNLIMIPHPLWFSISAVVGIVAAAWLASLLGSSVGASTRK